MILSHVNCFIYREVIGFQVLLDSLHPRSTSCLAVSSTSSQIKSNLKNFYSAPYNNGRERLTKYIGLIIKCEVNYNIGVSQECRAIGNIKQ